MDWLTVKNRAASALAHKAIILGHTAGRACAAAD
jgi:hypothetical protein